MMSAYVRIVVAALACLAGMAPAQIKLGLDVKPDTVLEYEPVIARLSILNNTGGVLDLGSNGNCQVRFVVRDNVGSPTKRLLPDTVAWHNVRVEPSMMLAVTNRLSDIYNLFQSGAYTIEAEVEWSGLVFSPKKNFVDVVPGVTVTELEAGAPDGGERRRYMLKILSRDRQDRLFLRMDDGAGDVCFGVFDLGRCIRMEAPGLRVDGNGLLHVLHQSGPFEHTYSSFSPDGNQVVQKIYSGEYKVVRLKTMNDGAVVVHESASLEAPLPRTELSTKPPAPKRARNKKD